MKPFIFIHIPRTAGNSIVKALPVDYDSHETAIQWRKRLKAKWNAFFKFTMVRNPWDRVLSWYLFCRQLRNIAPKEQYIYQMPFESWVNNGMRTHWETSNVKFNGENPLTLHEYIMDGPKLIVDFVGRFEHLSQDFNKVCKMIGAPNRRLPHIYKTRKASDHYRNYYNEITKKTIAKTFEKDIELFKYTF